MRYISLFAGIGGFDYALNRLGHECVWANEWDKYAAEIYNKRMCIQNEGQSEGLEVGGEKGRGSEQFNGNSKRLNGIDTRDIRTVSTSEIPNHDLLVGGFPCQAFSIAGKRRGFDDTRGTLFFEIARILKDKNPRYFILENVKGLLSHDGGRTFKTIIATLAELGYDLQWQVLNSKNFGVPQNRERVFIVGHLRGQPRPQVFPIRGADEKDVELEVRPETKQQVSPTIGTPSGGHHIPSVRYPLKFMKRNQRNIDGDHSFTVDSVNTGGVKQGTVIRRLTPTECERLQGFPDGWTEGISDTQRYKCLGNAVTTNVVYEVARRLCLDNTAQ